MTFRPSSEVLTTMLIAFVLVLAAALPQASGGKQSSGSDKSTSGQPKGQRQAGIQDALPAVLKQQAGFWNKGDLDGFMTSYLNSPKISYTSGGVVVNGWDALKKRYVEKYGSKKDTMGQLSFSDLKVTALGSSDALCIGNWHLERAKQPTLDGVFTLIFTKTNDGWKIIHDHTSAKPGA